VKRNWINMDNWIFWVVFVAPLVIAVFVAIGGGLVMCLWNWLLPDLFGCKQVTFWQAIGLLALCRILVGSLGGNITHRSKSRKRSADHWDGLTPEEREAFRQGLRSRHAETSESGGGAGAPA